MMPAPAATLIVASKKFLACLSLVAASTLMPAHAATLEASDDFSSPGDYTGGAGWSGNWTESGDGGGSPTAGDIQILGQQIRFDGDGSSNGFVFRELDASDLAVEAGLLLFFDIAHSSNLEVTDIFEVFASDDGGTTWTE